MPGLRRLTTPRESEGSGRAARARQLVRADDGAVVLEWVVMFPVILLVMLGTVQAALHVHARSIANGAASEAVTSGTTVGGTSASARTAGQKFIDNAGEGMFTSSTVQVDRTPTTVTVTVSGHSLSLLPGVAMPEIRQVVSGPIEQPPAP